VIKESTGRAHLAMVTATILFGVNYWIAKGLMPDYLQPMQIIFFRVSGAMLIAWLLRFIMLDAKEYTIERADIPRLVLSSLLGVAANQILFFKGLSMSTPVDTAIINALNPVLVLVFSVFLVKEKLNTWRWVGVIAGATGAMLLVLAGGKVGHESWFMSGNILILLNTASWSLYLIVSRPLMVKYHPLVLMQWIFSIGFLAVFPFTISQTLEVDISSFNLKTWLSILYIILGTTFLAYFFINYSLKRLSAPVVAYYTYLQPVLVAAIGIIMFNGEITFVKIVSCLLIFAGIYLINFQQKK
jgi:drug/metabolite transporter (DMT)-like permease